MEEKPKIDLKKHASQGVSKWTLVKYLVYLTTVAILSWLIWSKSRSVAPIKTHENIKEIHDIEVETP